MLNKKPGPKAKSAIDRFNEKWEPVPESGCWLWVAGSSDTRYGCFQVGTFRNQKKMNAHKASWVLHNGEVPKGRLVLHKCDVRECVNPDHLYIGSYSDNLRDAWNRSRR